MTIIENGFCKVRVHFMAFLLSSWCFFLVEKTSIIHIKYKIHIFHLFYIYISPNAPLPTGMHTSIYPLTHIQTHTYQTTTNLLPLAAAAVLAHSDIGAADNGHTLLHSMQWEYRVCIDFTTSIILRVLVTVNWTHTFEKQIDLTSWRKKSTKWNHAKD